MVRNAMHMINHIKSSLTYLPRLPDSLYVTLHLFMYRMIQKQIESILRNEQILPWSRSFLVLSFEATSNFLVRTRTQDSFRCCGRSFCFPSAVLSFRATGNAFSWNRAQDNFPRVLTTL